MFSLALRYPNLGHPCLARKAAENQSTTFKVVFAGKSSDMDLKSLLKGQLFLQPLEDTRRILQEKWTGNVYTKPVDEVGEIVNDVFEMNRWPTNIKQRLIPLAVTQVGEAIQSGWDGRQVLLEWLLGNTLTHYDHAYWVTLQIEGKHLIGLKTPQLFNFIHKDHEGYFYNVNFHAVYIHENDWHDLSIIHATDPHIAWRNDFIQPTVRSALGKDHASSFINFNEKFRNFIHYANQRHSEGKCDLILLTGDLVDFTTIKRKFVDGIGIPDDNFTLLRDLVTAWPTCKGLVVGEELKAPLFTLLGNHDYRPSEYPLICTYELAGGKDLYTSEQYPAYRLTRDEALAYESGPGKEMPYSDATTGIYDQSHLDHAPNNYRACINPDLDYIIPLGKHRIICLDSGPDKGEFTGLADAMSHALGFKSVTESRKDFIAGSPDSEGFAAEQIQFLEGQLSDVDGLAMVACHSPLINFRDNPPPHLFREAEHKELTPTELKELSAILFIKEYTPILAQLLMEYYKRLNDGDTTGALAVAKGIQAFTFDYWTKATGWSLQNTPHCKKGGRDPDLGRGVADERFNEFFGAITKKTKNNKNVELVLTGHTHHSLEFTAHWEDNLIAFLHDYYIDGTLDSLPPSSYWKTPLPDCTDPLNKTDNPKKWWQKHSPLFVQTLSAAAPPGSGENLGALRITIKGDVITHIERIHLIGALKAKMLAPQTTAYFILSASPP